jgi:hypothetical protein
MMQAKEPQGALTSAEKDKAKKYFYIKTNCFGRPKQ